MTCLTPFKRCRMVVMKTQQHFVVQLQEACIDTSLNVEADTASWARSVLPESAVEIVEGVMSQFQDRYRSSSASFENGTVSGTHTVASAQQQPWWPAYLMCLLNPEWAVPCFSPRTSLRVKEFLREISSCNFWTFRVYVTRLPSPATAPVDIAFIE